MYSLDGFALILPAPNEEKSATLATMVLATTTGKAWISTPYTTHSTAAAA
jgi:hypothetical protein